jgi:cytochrome c biogenesis protein CcdA
MPTYRTTLALVVLLLGVVPGLATGAPSGAEPPVVPVEFFHETGCHECERVQQEILPDLEQRYAGYYALQRYDIGEATNYLRLVAWQQALGVTNNEPVCVVVGGAMLCGVEGIRQGLFPALDRVLTRQLGSNAAAVAATPVPPVPVPDRALLAERVRGFTLAGILAAALVDSFNPCAMATLVFFMSLLSVSHIGVRRMALAGGAFVVACFLTYFALGFGLLRVIRVLVAARVLGMVIDGLMLVLMAVFAWLSFRDAARFRRSGDPGDVSLQLPQGLQRRIHEAMKRGLRRRNLLLGGLGIGFIVTVLESVCTGQVYVPALVLMIKTGASVWRCAGYLAAYNAVFVAPLIVILALTCWGLGTPALLAWSRRNVVTSKVLLGLFFTAMAAMMLALIMRSAI